MPVERSFVADLAGLAACASQSISMSELHGAVCGLAANRVGGQPGKDAAEALGDLLPALVGLVGSEALSDAASVDEFMQASVADLLAEDMSFTPLLPADDASIEARTQAIGEWCGAFAAGYGVGGASAAAAALDERSGELLQDFIAISGVVMDDEDEAEAETALVELEQYAKVGALLLAAGAPAGDGDD